GGESQLVLEVEDIGGDAFGVLADERALAGRDFYFVEIVPGRVAIVQADVDRIGLTPRHGKDRGSDSFYVREIASRGYVLSGSGCIGGIDGVDVVVLIAGFILNEKYVLAVARPEETGDWALGVGRDWFRAGERLGRLLHPDVACAVERFDKRDIGAVWRNLSAGNFWVAKKELAVNQRRTLRPHGGGERDDEKR